MDDLDQLIKDAKQNTDYMANRAPLSSAEKERILNLTLGKIAQEMNMETKGVIRMKKIKKRLPIILAATLCLGVVSISAATFFHLKAPLAKSVNVTTSEANTIGVAGADLMACCSQSGVTINATQVIGDQYGFYVLLEMSSPEFTNQNISFDDSMVEIDGVDALTWDFNTVSYENHTVYGVINVRTPDNLIGKDIHITLNQLTTDTQYIADAWKLNWKLDYQDVSKEFAVNQMIELYGGKALFESVYVSPLSVYVTLDEKEAFKTYGDFDDTITVKLHDGSVITSNSDNVYNDTTVIGLYLGKLTNLSDIESVTFGGIEVPINSNFEVQENDAGKKLVVSNVGSNEADINRILEEDSTAIIQSFDLTSGTLDMDITYDYQEPNSRLVVTYTGLYTHTSSYPTSFYAISDIDLQKATRRNCADTIDLSLVKEALKSGQFEILADSEELKSAQRDYVMNLSDDVLDALLSDINFSDKNGSVQKPQVFLLDQEDTLLVSLTTCHAIGDHIELVITPQ